MSEKDTTAFKNTVKNRGEQDDSQLITDGGRDIQAATDDELADKLAGVADAAEAALSNYDLAVIGEAVSRLSEDQEAADPEMATDGGGPTDRTHVDSENGLWIPQQFRDEGQVIIRTPRATIQHYGGLGSYYGMIDESHFGSPDEFRDAKNEHLAPDQVSIKNAGEDAERFNVEIHPDVVADGGVTIESEFLVRATQLEDVSVSTEEDKFIVTIREPADGVIDASPVVDLANECGHSIGPVLADIETPELTVEVER